MSSSPAGSDQGKLFIVSAPSGTGKTTLVERLVLLVDGLKMSRSYTSRPARAGERDGVDYNFISRDCFAGMMREGEFLEYADVFGNYYGTGKADTDALLAQGCDVVLVIDVQGARQVRALRDSSVGIFVLPPSLEVLERRLRGRSKDSEEQIGKRLEMARQEVPEYAGYEYVIVNDELEPAVERLRAIVLAERAKAQSMRGKAEEIIETFTQPRSVRL
jgi:guanylate kinase